MAELFWFILPWALCALIGCGVMWCSAKIRARRNKAPIFHFEPDDTRAISGFITLYMIELGYLHAPTEMDLHKYIPMANIHNLDILMAVIMLGSSLLLIRQFKKHWKRQSRDEVGIIILLGVLQTALAMIVASDNQSIMTRLVGNVIYLLLPAYVLYQLSIKPFSSSNENNKDG
ncbi:hypothetical protein KRX19_11465 [Cardiobacteriaceae bacterium TAE3-ERU3]|nr:hypothetical protein [Cardiobacteriaceae bacterium TAE3-ERU3]